MDNITITINAWWSRGLEAAQTTYSYSIEYIARDATALAQGNNLTGPSNADERNAIAHAHTSAKIAYDYAELVAVLAGDFKELLPGGKDPNDIFKDQYNNEVGRRIGEYAEENNLSETDIDNLIIDAYKNGDLISDLSDPKIENKTDPTWSNPSPDWEVASDGRDYTGLPDPVEDYALPLANKLFESLPPWIQDVIDIFSDSLAAASPLVLDIDGDGIELSAQSVPGSVYWDVDLDGMAEATGWISGGDGLLAIDSNADGVINDHSELFGDQTGSPNGFAALAVYDSNSDSIISNADNQWGDLVVWIDTNANGYSEASELHTLDSLGITSINLSYSNANYDISGNEIKQESTFTINGQTHDIVDAWFAYDNVNTVYVGDYTLDVRTLFLPSLRGFGNLPDLHISMSQDETLLNMVQELASSDVELLVSREFEFMDKVKNIVLRWAGVADVVAGSRGIFVTAQNLEFLEKIFGEQWSVGYLTNPLEEQGRLADIAFDAALSNIAGQILVQTAGRGLFSTVPSYDIVAGKLSTSSAILDFQIIQDIASVFNHSDLLESVDYWLNFLSILQNVTDLSSLSQVDLTSLQAIIQQYGPVGDVSALDIIDAVTASTGIIVNGDGSDNTLIGTRGNDSIVGFEGNDVLLGWAGDDNLEGRDGNDTYRFSSGWGVDTIVESLGQGTDTIEFTNLASTDFWVYTDYYGRFIVQSKNNINDRIVMNVFQSNGATVIGDYLENIVFTDTTWDLTSGLTFNGSTASDYLYGSNSNDTIFGNAGNDHIYGNDGDDILNGGTGNDALEGGNGNDIYRFEAGWGTDTLTEALGEGSDTIEFTDMASTDLWVYTDYYGRLVLQNQSNPYDKISIVSYQSGNLSTVADQLETIVFTDTTWDLTSGLTFNGSTASDYLYGSNSNDTIFGNAANDFIYGNDGDDILNGGTGNDALEGGNGNDIYRFEAGWGTDTLTEALGEGSDTIEFTDMASTDLWVYTDYYGRLVLQNQSNPYDKISIVSYQSGNLSTVADQLETIVFTDTTWDLTSGLTLSGTTAGDTLYGSNSGDIINGNAGNDYLYGNSGIDVLIGGDGNDTLYGGGGDDKLFGGVGADNLYGNDGADLFIFDSITAFSGVDTIRDFDESEGDAIDISDVLFNYNDSVDDIADFVSLVDNGTHTTIAIDQNGGGNSFTDIAVVENTIWTSITAFQSDAII